MFGSTLSVPPLLEGWNLLAINLSNLALIWSQHSRMSTVSLAGGECAFNCHLPTPGPSMDPFKIILEPPRASIICWHASDSQRDGGMEWRAGIEDPDIRVCPSPGRGGRFSHWQPARRRRPLKGHRCARPGAGAGARSRRGGEVPRAPPVARGGSSCQWAATGKARLDLKNRPSTTPLF